jgi:hypothetical protein
LNKIKQEHRTGTKAGNTKFKKIIICPHYNNLISRNNDNYAPEVIDFTRQLVKMTFERDIKYEVQNDNPVGTGPVWGLDFCEIVGLNESNIGKPNFSYLCEPYELDVNSYVVLNTKARGLDNSLWDKNKQSFVEALKSISTKYNIVFLGDRDVDLDTNSEYRNWPHLVFCIYNDLKHLINGNQFIDKTQSRIMQFPNMERFRKDCYLVQKSFGVIQLGIGGSFITSLGVNKNCHCLLNPSDVITGRMAIHLCKYDRYYMDFGSFINGVRNL